MKRGIYFLLFLFISFVISLFTSWPDNNIHIIFCDVGQGDAIFITLGFYQMLVDGGPDASSVSRCISQYTPFWDRTIDVVIATHMDADHITGLSHVLENYDVGVFVTSPTGKNTVEFSDLRSAVLNSKITTFFPKASDQIVIGPKNTKFVFSTVWPKRVIGEKNVFSPELTESEVKIASHNDMVENKDMNSLSISGVIEYDNFSVLLTGDLDRSSELALVSDSLINDLDILKVGHHGSKTSTSDVFLEKARPEISVISASKNNRFGHPHTEVLEKLQNIHSTIYSTAQFGDVHFVSNGKSYWIEK